MKALVLGFVSLLASGSEAGAGDSPLRGRLVIGHEVRTFQPCTFEEPLWLTGTPASIDSLMQSYRKALPGASPYAPLFATIAGRRVDAPAQGFGADYPGGFEVRELVRTWPAGNCNSDRTMVR